jgi:hypothetical protein
MLYFEEDIPTHSDVMVILHTEKLPKTNKSITMVSHGINVRTFENVILPNVFLDQLGAVVFDKDYAAYFLK